MKVKELFESSISFRDLDLTVSNGQLKHDYSNDICEGELEIVNDELRSLKGFPKEIVTSRYGDNNISWGSLFCSCRNLESLEYAPKKVEKSVYLDNCGKITSLKGIGVDYLQEAGMYIHLPKSITSNILGLLKVKNLKECPTGNFHNDLLEAIKIINKHLKSGRRLSKCKQELEDKGLKEYAKL